MNDIAVAFSLGEFLQWLLIGFCFAFIFQDWQKYWSEKVIIRNVCITIFLSISISLFIFLVGGSTITILAALAFGLGILTKLLLTVLSRYFISMFIFSKPHHKAI